MTNLFRKAALTILCIAGCTVLAQEPGTPPPDSNDQPVTTLRSNVNVVNLLFNVRDKHKGLVAGLTKDDFEVYEDGKQQTIKYFSANTEEPLTLGILIDTSGSQIRMLPMEQEVGANFLAEILRPKDLAFVINFDVDVSLVQDFTNSTHQLRRALNRVKINTGLSPVGSPGGPPIAQGPIPDAANPRGTLLYDAVYLAGDEKLKNEAGRKALILLTDGEDQGSRLKLRDAIEAAQRSDAIVYVLMIADREFYGGMGYSGDSDMKKLAEQTGGRVIDAGTNQKKMKEAFDQISAEMRSQYSIGYTPTNNAMDGSFRKIQVKTRNKDLKVQVRSGYYAPKANEQSNAR